MIGMNWNFKLAGVLILAFAMLFTPSPARADIGAEATGVITGSLTNDLNGNGILEPGDLPLAGWRVVARNSTNDIIASDTTALNGFYSLTIPNNQGGIISVSEELQPGWIKTFPAFLSYTFNIQAASGLSSLNNDFSNFQPGSISGMKFNDLNGNGVRDTITCPPGKFCPLMILDEPGLGGWTIWLTRTDNLLVSLRAVTAGDGTFSFTGLTNGTYTLTEDPQGGWMNTLAPAPVDIRSGTFSTGNNFGNYHGGIMGQKFNDTNGNGILDTGENGLAGWTIRIIGLNVPVQRSTTTDANGNYIFTNVPAGTYLLMEITQTGWVPMTRTAVIIETKTVGETKIVNFGNRRLIN